MAKNAKGKGKGKGKGDEVDEAMIEKFHVLDYKLQALQHKTLIEQEKAEKEKAAENELRARAFELDRDYKNEQEKLIAITSDMTRQYKQMQDSLKKETRVLTKTSEEKDVIITQKADQLSKMKEDYEYRLKKKEDDVNELKKKIDDMSSEFAAMLRDTLNKMQERIEMAQWDNEPDPQLMKKIKDIASNGV